MLIRVLNAVLVGILGIVFGTLGTLVHSSTIGTAQLPWGIVVALAALGCLLVGIRLLSDSRLYALCAAIGALVAIGVLSQKSFGGSVLITSSVIGWTWMGGAVAISLIVVAWPRPRQPQREA
ncbi:hypothetical protein HII28_04860 [Planctomonas sp. JC2975]|uniref:DUF6113 family protein n=1 Tax=Planctomonas sp. JC2975 TaxID=2729626 RepID=UPI0014728898|nr:DUF6113 family protein [Planctomonas sp. JC2975]NNC11208.1 hypothetical protein [Planctomonas sp. JC2975]